MKKTTVLATAAFVLIGCQPAQPLDTPSHQPEAMLYDVDASCVRNAFLNLLVNKGFQVKTVNDTQIVVGRGARNFGAQLLLGTPGGGKPEERMTVLFLSMPNNGLRVVISGAYVSNPGTGFEKLTQIPPNANDQQQMQQMGSNLSQTCHKVG